MAAPTEVLWARDPHTAAKHTLLRRYLNAWFPIMARQFRETGITFLDGFAGPGEYTNASESSPTIAIAQAMRDDVTLRPAHPRSTISHSTFTARRVSRKVVTYGLR